jgi:lipopolysaccharide/colanic/teichoic acid biosynthesis glycosyltransferase
VKCLIQLAWEGKQSFCSRTETAQPLLRIRLATSAKALSLAVIFGCLLPPSAPIILLAFNMKGLFPNTIVSPARMSAHPLSRALKRVLDVGLSVCLCPIVLPLIGFFALMVKLEDGGCCFYRRRVVGQAGEFDAFKLRTMRADAEMILQRNPQLRAEYEKDFKLRNDPRVTRIGKLLRKLSLDELPQLLNVLKGQMSLVGPRMITRPELEKYGPYRDLLLTVKPGLTGYWQVSGRQEVSYDQRVSMDVFYINNWSLWLDFNILMRTVLVVISGRGAI